MSFTTYVVITVKSPHLLSTARSGDFAHDLLSRHKKEIFHHNISGIVLQYSADSFTIASPMNHALCVLADTHDVTIGIPLCSYPPGQVLILAQETLFTTSSTEPLVVHDHFSGDPLYSTIALQPIVSAATTISHTHIQRPYQKTKVLLLNAVVLGSMS